MFIIYECCYLRYRRENNFIYSGIVYTMNYYFSNTDLVKALPSPSTVVRISSSFTPVSSVSALPLRASIERLFKVILSTLYCTYASTQS